MLLQNGEHAIPLLADSFDEYLDNNEYTFVNFVRLPISPFFSLPLFLVVPWWLRDGRSLGGLGPSWPGLAASALTHPYTHTRHKTERQFAPWCVWCQRLHPTWEAFAEKVEEEKIPIKVAKVSYS